jgi:hypothetical protein
MSGVMSAEGIDSMLLEAALKSFLRKAVRNLLIFWFDVWALSLWFLRRVVSSACEGLQLGLSRSYTNFIDWVSVRDSGGMLGVAAKAS